MCVRYTFHEPDRAMAALVAALAGKLVSRTERLGARYNVALTALMPVAIMGPAGPMLRELRWGLVPRQERGKPRPHLLANARAETASTLGAFKAGVAGRRCLVPANGFYEWKTMGRAKEPHLFSLQN